MRLNTSQALPRSGELFHLGGNPTALVMSYDAIHKSSASGMNGPATLDSKSLLYLEMALLTPLRCKRYNSWLPHGPVSLRYAGPGARALLCHCRVGTV